MHIVVLCELYGDGIPVVKEVIKVDSWDDTYTQATAMAMRKHRSTKPRLAVEITEELMARKFYYPPDGNWSVCIDFDV